MKLVQIETHEFVVDHTAFRVMPSRNNGQVGIVIDHKEYLVNMIVRPWSIDAIELVKQWRRYG